MTSRADLHERWMRRALEVARGASGDVGARGAAELGRGFSGDVGARGAAELGRAGAGGIDARGGADDVPVGAVIFDASGLELGAGRNEREATGDPTAHAEILALRRAAARRGEWRLDGCTLVVTLEPCTMCAGALVLARIGTVVFGPWEPKTGAAGSLWDVLRDRRLTHRPEVYPGVLEAECAALLLDFFRTHRAP